MGRRLGSSRARGARGVASLALLGLAALRLAVGGPWLHALYAWLGVAVLAAYAIHDVARLAGLTPDDAVEACLHLYLDVANLALLALDCLVGAPE